MKKLTVMILSAAVVLFASDWPGLVEQVAYARDGGRVESIRGGGGAIRGGGYRGGGFRDGGYRGYGHGHGGGHFNVWLGPVWGWDPFFYPYYSYYPYPYYSQPPVVIEQQPQEYILPEQPKQETQYWYYCSESKTYYPYVKSCPGGWMKVVPTPPKEE